MGNHVFDNIPFNSIPAMSPSSSIKVPPAACDSDETVGALGLAETLLLHSELVRVDCDGARSKTGQTGQRRT